MTPAYSCTAAQQWFCNSEKKRKKKTKEKKKLNELFISLVGVIVLTKSAQPESITFLSSMVLF